MSYKITDWVWKSSRARGPAHHVLLAIAERADDDGVAWPSMGDIARRCRIGIGTVQRAIPKLVEIGELKVFEGGTGARSNRYRVVIEPGFADSGSFQSGTQSVPERNTKPNGSRSAPEGQRSAPEGQRSAPEGQRSAPGIEPATNRSENRSENQPPPPARANRPAARTAVEEAAYPDWLTPLQDAMSAAGINPPWNFEGDDMIRLHNDIKRLGIPLMVEQAVKAEQSATKPPFSSRFFYPGWHAMRAPVAVGDGPTDGGNVVALRSTPTSRQQQETDDLFDRAMARAKARMQQES